MLNYNRFFSSFSKYSLLALSLNLFCFIPVQAATEQALCQQSDLLKEAKAYQELLIPEADFNLTQSLAAIQYLNDTLPSLIDEAKKPTDIAENPMYYVKYPKSVGLIEGYLYLQTYQLAVLNAQLNPKEDNKAALQKIAKAKKTFCDFYEMNMLSAD